MKRVSSVCRVSFTVIVVLLSLSVWAGIPQGSTKRPLSHDDYDAWKSISGSSLSADGNWVCYIEAPQEGDAELVVVNVKNSNEYRHLIGYTGEGTEAARSARPQFSYDASHLVFMISPTQEEVKTAKKEKVKKEDEPKKKLAVMKLADGTVEIIERVKGFELPEKASGWVAYLKEEEKKDEVKEEGKKEEEAQPKEEEKKKEKKKDYGTPLAVKSLQDGRATEFSDVLSYRFTKNGRYLFYIVSSKEKPETDGIYRLVPGDSLGTALVSGTGNYKRWAVDKEETNIVFLTDKDDYEADEPTFNLYGMKIDAPGASLWVSHTATPDFPAGMSVSDKSELSFSEDGKILMFGIKEIPEPKKEEEEGEAEEKAKFDLWHWNDPYPQPQQKLMANRVKDNTWESLYFINSKKFIKIADESLPDVTLSRAGNLLFAENSWPYTKRVSYDGSYSDIYVIDPKTGERTIVMKELYGGASLSPNAKYVTWFSEGDWYVYDIAKKATKNITSGLDVVFEREDHDTPNPPGSYGTAGWTDNDASLLVYDRYDIWEIKPDGSTARMITEGYGRKNNLSFRYVRLDREEVTIDPQKTMLLDVTNEETMASGFYRDQVAGSALPAKLIMADKSFGRPQKADNAEILMLTRQTFDEFPDIWVSDMNFSNIRKVTDLGKQMESYIWGKAELRDFLSADGKALKGILIKPEDFDANRKYPLMVYIYETLHQGLHSFRNPSPGTSINTAYYVSNGYIIWQPDIEYDTGYPGQDALKCVLPGIHMLIGEGYVDPDAIGIQGHSWGGYQISYMVTQTNIFTAAEAGAPVSNMVSAYGGIRWGSGMVRQFQYERTQSRLGASLWEVPMRYLENSPIFWADKVQTPLLILHNDNDDAVPWYQGIEYIMALRRLDKEAYMFNYNGEPHGLRKRVNQMDFTIRMQEFFDHHLKGAPAPEWMTNGIKAWQKEEK